MGTLLRDIRYGWRRLAASPGFTAVAVLSLALGLGANTAIFSLVNAAFFSPPPVAEPEQLVSVAVRGKNDSILAFSYPNYRDFRDRNEVFSGLIAHGFTPMGLSGTGGPAGDNERVWGYLVSGNYFEVLGVRPALGRLLAPDDDRARLARPVAVLSFGCWQRRFGGDPSAVGREVVINGHGFEVVGVAPEGFRGTELPYVPEIWVPVTMQPWINPDRDWLDERGDHNLFATGRLKPGVSRAQAEASLNRLAARLGEEYPDTNEGEVIQLVPPGFVVPEVRRGTVGFAAVLAAAVVLVLLLACTNLASLLLARAAGRRKEVAVRLALGAGRWRIVRQLLTESLLLSLAGGVTGLLLALWLVDLAAAFKPPSDVPLSFDLRVDARVLLFALAASLLTGVVFGLAPALQTSKPDLVSALKDSTAQTGYRRSRLRGGLVVAQVALSLVLLVAAGLVVRALGQLQTVKPGFEPENALMMSFDLGLQGYERARGREFQRQLLERVRSLPGVKSAALTNFVPLSIYFYSTWVYVEGQPPVRGANSPVALLAVVGPRYFETIGTPLVAGRDFGEQDKEGERRVAVVNETFARQLLPGPEAVENAVGKRFSRDGAQGPFFEIVGVARDGKYWGIGEQPRPFVWLPLGQRYEAGLTLLVRTTSAPVASVSAVRDQFRALDAALPVYDVKTLKEHMSLSLFPARVAAAALGGFGLLALVLAAVGLYGVMSYAVAQRTREVGVRMALGARQRDILVMVVGQGLSLALIGVAAGLAAALALTRAMRGLLYGVSATDPWTFAAVTLLLTLVALVASYLPARRATRVDPMVALRYE